MSDCGCRWKLSEAVKFLDIARAGRKAAPDDIVAAGCLRDAVEDLEEAARELVACELCGSTHKEDCDMGVDCRCHEL